MNFVPILLVHLYIFYHFSVNQWENTDFGINETPNNKITPESY